MLFGRKKGLDEAQPEKQMLKLVEEVGELAQGLAKGNLDQVIDSIGDVYVVLTILSIMTYTDVYWLFLMGMPASFILRQIGIRDADALYRYGAVYAERKRVHAEVIQASRGTVAEKESLAEIETYELRLREVEAKVESRKWQNLFKATENLIIAYRRDERTALEEYKKVNDIYGR